MEPLAVGDLLDHAATALTGEAEQAGCRIEVTVAPDLPALTGDPIALEHAFRNLIANAARYAAQGSGSAFRRRASPMAWRFACAIAALEFRTRNSYTSSNRSTVAGGRVRRACAAPVLD